MPREPRQPDGPSERFAAYLRAEGALDDRALERAERARHQSGERLDVVLNRLGILTEAEITRHAAAFMGLAFLPADELPEVPPLIAELDPAFLRTRRVVPVGEAGGRLRVAVADPFDPEPAAALAYLIERPVETCVASESEILRLLEAHYGASRSSIGEVAADAVDQDTISDEDVRRLADMASEAPVIRLVHDIIGRAIERQASDIHLEPGEDRLRVRLRIDGLLLDGEALPPALAPAVISRIKVMSRLDIAERRLPQDGRTRATVRGRDVDIRVSTMPTHKGESVVLRILDRSAVVLELAPLGFGGATVAALSRLLEEPNGLVLVTGPTGSGKTTTLYAGLSRLNAPQRKVFTVEDPIEYQLAGVSQVQVQPRIGLTFASALRSILRQDPDVIMVGEIRDLETARMAMQAALTGHLVLSTVHTNSAAATIVRLLDMGVEDYLLASTVKGVLAQRLVRRLCERCAVAAGPPGALASCARRFPTIEARLAGKATRLLAPVGCAHCNGTGYRGRLCVAELLAVTDGVRGAMVRGERDDALEAAAVADGMVGMLEDGLGKVLDGQTTLDEVLRVTRGG